MTPREAEAVAAAVSEADGGCSTCVASLTGMLMLDIPGVDWVQLVWEQAEVRGDTRESFEEGVRFYRDQAKEIRAREATRP